MPTHISRLPKETVEYLELATRSHARRAAADDKHACPGVMIHSWSGAFGSPRAGWWLALLAGLALLGAAGYAARHLPETRRSNLVPLSVACGVALGLGYVLLRTGLTRASRPGPDYRVGSFLFADATRVWEVVGGYVETFDFGDDVNTVGYRHSTNGAYTHTTITARSDRSGSRTWSISDMRNAQRLLDFLQVVGHLRRSDDETHRSIADSGPGYVARAAVLILDDGARPADGYPPIVHPPGPVPREAQVSLGGGALFARWLTGIAIAGAAGYAAWKGGEYLLDERLFAAARAETGDEFKATDFYLSEFPDGRHVAEVRDLRDDRNFALIPKDLAGETNERFLIDRYLSRYPNGRHTADARDLRDDWFFAAARRDPDKADYIERLDAYVKEYPNGRHAADVRDLRDDKLFAVAVKESETSESPGGLRKYLSERRNTRHRMEATKLIGGYYERTAADLKARAEKLKAQADKDKNGEKIDPQLIRSMIALVESLKDTDDPVLTVGFKPEIEAEPKAGPAKAGEEDTYKFHLAEGKFKDELKALEEKNPRKTAIIPLSETFEDEFVKSREDVLFRRLSDAIQKGIKADVLTLRRAKPGEAANIEVRYRVFPAGFVVPFTEVNDDDSHKRTIGLTRQYYIDWTLTFRPPGGGPESVYRTQTRPGAKLLYRIETGDPDWAIYAVKQFSAFYGLSDTMIRALGQDPGPMPDAFTFKGTSSFRDQDKPRPPFSLPKFDPLKFNPPKFEFPKLPGRKFP